MGLSTKCCFWSVIVQPSGVHAYPSARIDVPSRSTPIQSPVVYKDPLTGQRVRAPSVASGLSSFNSITEAHGACQSSNVVDVSQCVSGTSDPPPTQPTQAGNASMGAKSSHLLLKLQCYDGSKSLETFLLKFQLFWTAESTERISRSRDGLAFTGLM